MSLQTLSPTEVDAIIAKVRGDASVTPDWKARAMRTLVHEALQGRNRFPLSKPIEVKHDRVSSRDGVRRLDFQQETVADAPFPQDEHVTDQHRIEVDRARAQDPGLIDAKHMLQKRHGTALWQETDRLLEGKL